ncbi:MAG: hypothetical protein LBH45_07260 [Campylobacteraceae bacterium]|jgi:hypothetical protein|nr:hypothetical protein [Campylobacteraceae bacterium]
MDIRKLEIRIYDTGGDWFIDEGIKKTKNHSYTPLETPFATCYAKEGHIQYLFDIVITEAQMAAARKMKEFLEVCEFTCGKDVFMGDFVDALLYILHKEVKSGKKTA